VIADCNRALRRWNEVDLRWTQLREASPSAALMAEGRIVVAGSLADRGRLAEAVGLLDRARWRVKHPRDHHLATAYALADLLERSGDVARARETFGWLVDVDPDFADAARRLAAVGGARASARGFLSQGTAIFGAALPPPLLKARSEPPSQGRSV
jgi:tetratricopeptide (TPR) repeat protein